MEVNVVFKVQLEGIVVLDTERVPNVGVKVIGNPTSTSRLDALTGALSDLVRKLEVTVD